MNKLILIASLALVWANNAADNQLTPGETKAGWKLLFDGQTTKGWHSYGKTTFPEKGWVVQDDTLHVIAGSKAGDILSDETFSDFDLSWEWKIEKGGNNGVKYFVNEERRQAVGHEYQMLDDVEGHDPGEKHSTASFYDVLPPDPHKQLNPPGQWNLSRVLVQVNHVEHWLNGKKVLEYELGSLEVLAAVQKSKFRTIQGFGTKTKGHILLTYHNDAATFRNIKIRDLSQNPK